MVEKAMARTIKKVAGIFSVFKIPRVPRHGDAQKKIHRKEAVQQVSNGNVLLQLGQYITEEDIERLKKEIVL